MDLHDDSGLLLWRPGRPWRRRLPTRWPGLLLLVPCGCARRRRVSSPWSSGGFCTPSFFRGGSLGATCRGLYDCPAVPASQCGGWGARPRGVAF
eukprot:15455839-Alexandrium_andersonii.AAC.1